MIRRIPIYFVMGVSSMLIAGALGAAATQNAPPAPAEPQAAAAPDATTAADAAAPAADDIVAAPPVIPSTVFNLKDFGGVGDGATFNTQAFTKAVAAIKAAGGGQLVVPAGVYVTLPFNMTSHMDLHLEAGAIIKAPETFKEWGLPEPANAMQEDIDDAAGDLHPLIGGNHLTDIAITGSGTIDGSGAIWWIWSDKAARRYPAGRLIYPRPRLVEFRDCQRLHFDGVTLSNSPMFHLHALQCDDMTIENVRVYSPSDSPNTDALNVGGNRIVIRKCHIDNGDDQVALQSGTQNVLIEDLTCLHGHGISIGSPTNKGLHHIFVRRCSFDSSDNGIRIKSYRGRGGLVEDIHYSDITMTNVNRAIDINMLYNGNANVKSDVGPREANGKTQLIPQVHHITISHLTVTHTTYAGRILGLPELPVSDIKLDDVNIEADYGLTVQDATDVVLNNVKLDIHVGPPFTTDNAKVTWNH
jgi:polygalacturonase